MECLPNRGTYNLTIKNPNKINLYLNNEIKIFPIIIQKKYLCAVTHDTSIENMRNIIFYFNTQPQSRKSFFRYVGLFLISIHQ